LLKTTLRIFCSLPPHGEKKKKEKKGGRRDGLSNPRVNFKLRNTRGEKERTRPACSDVFEFAPH